MLVLLHEWLVMVHVTSWVLLLILHVMRMLRRVLLVMNVRMLLVKKMVIPIVLLRRWGKNGLT